jgi:hypothetical protein
MLGNSQQSSLFRHGAKSNFGGLGSLGAGASSAMDALKRQAGNFRLLLLKIYDVSRI